MLRTKAWWAPVALATLAVAACNGDGANPGGGDTTSDDDGATSGGGMASSGGMGTTSQGGSTAMGGSATTGGSAPTPCEYPPGPYGVAEGDIVPPDLTWQVFAPGENTPTTLAMADLQDCDGSRGIDAIKVDSSAYF